MICDAIFTFIYNLQSRDCDTIMIMDTEDKLFRWLVPIILMQILF